MKQIWKIIFKTLNYLYKQWIIGRYRNVWNTVKFFIFRQRTSFFRRLFLKFSKHYFSAEHQFSALKNLFSHIIFQQTPIFSSHQFSGYPPDIFLTKRMKSEWFTNLQRRIKIFLILGIRYLNIKFRQTFKKIKHPFSADRNFRQRFLKIAEKYRAPKNAVAEKWRTLQ